MAEAIISRRGSNQSGPKVNKVLRTETITGNTNWTVPISVNNEFSVRIFGGGGVSPGGGGWMNNGEFTLTPNDTIQITIGRGGNWQNRYQHTGGTSSFGTYLSAVGGDELNGGSGGGGGGIGYQFGGGGGSYNGGRGGIWGGGGGGGGGFGGNGICILQYYA